MKLNQIGERTLTTDVLVVGGGTAGCLAALRAKKQGADVIMVEKGGSITRSGCLASGLDHYPITQGVENFDDPGAFVSAISKRPPGLYDRAVAEVYAREARNVFNFLEHMGVPFKDPKTGQYRFVATLLGSSKPDVYSFEGARIKPLMADTVRKAGVRVLERLTLLGLLTNNHALTGAVGFHVRNADFYVIKSKTVVICTGGVSRLYPTLAGMPFIHNNPPFNTGDGHMMAFRAGAALTNMEFTISSVEPIGFSSVGLSGFVGFGAYLINARGERYMANYGPLLERSPRNVAVYATLREYKDGRGPCYIDCRHLDRETIDHVKLGIKNERAVLLEFFEAKGLDIAKDPIPVAPREFHLAGSGIMIDQECQSTFDGLFAAGECSNVPFAAPGAFTFGWIAGEKAGIKALKNSFQEIDPRQIDYYKEEIYSPLLRPGKYDFEELENELRWTMSTHVGFEREASRLEEGINNLKSLQEKVKELRAGNPHELMRTNETRNIINSALLIARAALERKESRAIPCHFRVDYPEKNDQGWRGFVMLNKGDFGEVRVSFRPCA